MITTSSHSSQQGRRTGWQAEMASCITSPEELVSELGLDPGLIAAARRAGSTFRLRVPRSFVGRMRPGDVTDPLLRQVLPLAAELDDAPGYISDPVGERSAARAPGLLQKYRGRALLLTTSACASHCRYCFRREFPYSEQADESARWAAALAEIERDTSLEEIILSGGDPLSLSNRRLRVLTEALERIEHVRRLRVHTRQPIVLPARVDRGLIDWLHSINRPVVVVLHAHHPNEIDAEVRAACAGLRNGGATLLNQTVLMQGINDDASVLANLSRRLFEAGVLPYYLHALDPVRGAAHFAVPDDRARQIAGDLSALLPGYLVPRLVREVRGAPAKVTLPPVLRTVDAARTHLHSEILTP
jgi:EF-P beta-lysylation protein EpmB